MIHQDVSRPNSKNCSSILLSCSANTKGCGKYPNRLCLLLIWLIMTSSENYFHPGKHNLIRSDGSNGPNLHETFIITSSNTWPEHFPHQTPAFTSRKGLMSWTRCTKPWKQFLHLHFVHTYSNEAHQDCICSSKRRPIKSYFVHKRFSPCLMYMSAMFLTNV